MGQLQGEARCRTWSGCRPGVWCNVGSVHKVCAGQTPPPPPPPSPPPSPRLAQLHSHATLKSPSAIVEPIEAKVHLNHT